MKVVLLTMSILIYTTYLLCIGGVFSITDDLSKETQKTQSLKIINGDYTNITSYPWAVSFLVENDIWGAGVILSKKWILTSAFNCLWVDPSYITVRVGSTYWNQSGSVFKTDKCIIHENYTGTYDYNIALLKVKGKIALGSETTKKISPPLSPRTPIKPKVLSVCGWGVRTSIYEKETHLQWTNQTIIDDDKCRSTYNSTGTTFFCAHNTQDINAGPCIFDYGAPLISYAHSKKQGNRRVFGLYLGSRNCSEPSAWPAVYVDVYQFRAWIKETMKNN